MKRPLAVIFAATFALAAFAAGARAEHGINPGTHSDVVLSVPEPTQGFTVAILADRTGGPESGLAVLERTVEELNLLQPELVFHIGDLVPGYIRDMQQWERDIQKVKNILKPLEAPFYPLPGNHDVITGTGNTTDRRGEQLYKRQFGPLYYSLDYRNTHFVMLYTDEALQSQPRVSEKQLQWLRQDLQSTDARNVFLLMHKPLWEYEDVDWERIHRVLTQHPVRAVIAGHFHHYYKSIERDGIQYYVLGVTGGQTFSPELAGGLEHYCLLRIEPDSYRMALLRPGYVLPDDYIVAKDFKAMEKLRFLDRDRAGVLGAVRSPEGRAIDGNFTVVVENPLEVPVSVEICPRKGSGPWRSRPSSTVLALGAHARGLAEFSISSPAVSPLSVTVPEVEIRYTYLDFQGRSVPIVLPRRVPLLRSAQAALSDKVISVDGRGEEPAWRNAPLLTTRRWRTSPYEREEAGPMFRLLPTSAGVYLYVESPDRTVSDFRGERMLSDAIFVGLAPQPDSHEAVSADQQPVIVLYPFTPPGGTQAVQTFWDPRRLSGIEAGGVYAATHRPTEDSGWRCEAFIPWDLLLGEAPAAGQELLLNLGAWDNDGDLFTELHSWAPTSSSACWGRLRLLEEAAE